MKSMNKESSSKRIWAERLYFNKHDDRPTPHSVRLKKDDIEYIRVDVVRNEIKKLLSKSNKGVYR